MTKRDEMPSDDIQSLTGEEVVALRDRVLQLLRDMPAADDYGKVQALMTLVIAATNEPDVACAAFARSAALLNEKFGKRVHVHVLSEGRTVVFEGETAVVRTFEMDEEGDMVEVGETPMTVN